MFQAITVPILDYSYYLNQGYNRHKNNIQLDDAQKCYTIAITLRPYRSEAYYNRALLMFQSRNEDEAIKDIRAAISCEYLSKCLKIHKTISPTYNGKTFDKKVCQQFLLNSIQYSSNNYLARSLFRTFIGSVQQGVMGRQSIKLKNYELVWSGQSQDQNLQITESPIYPNNKFRLNGLCSISNKNKKMQQMNQLLQIYQNILSAKKNTEKMLAVQDRSLVESKSKMNQIDSNTVNLLVNVHSVNRNEEKSEQDSHKQDPFNYSNSRIQFNSQRSLQVLPLNLNQNKSNGQDYSNQQCSKKQSQSNSFQLYSRIKSVSSFKHFETTQKYDFLQRMCHNGCVKCNKSKCKDNSQQKSIFIGKNKFSDSNASEHFLKIQIKTVQIYRSQILSNPKPYIIISQSDQHNNFEKQNEGISEVDYTGAYFPKWGSLSFYVQQNYEDNTLMSSANKQDISMPPRFCKVQLWHKDIKGDILIGSAKFSPKIGRFKCSVSKLYPKQIKKRQTGYIFMHIKK